MDTIEYISRVKSALGITSDYALAAKLGVTRGYVSRLQSKHEVMSNKLARQFAEILDIPAGIVVLHAEIERARRSDDGEAIRVWEEIQEGFLVPLRHADRFAGSALHR